MNFTIFIKNVRLADLENKKGASINHILSVTKSDHKGGGGVVKNTQKLTTRFMIDTEGVFLNNKKEEIP